MRVGHDVTAVAELEPGIDDERVLALATGEDRILPTSDTDFGELVYRQRKASAGVLLLRLAGVGRAAACELVCGTIEAHAGEFRGAFSVLTPEMVRIRQS